MGRVRLITEEKYRAIVRMYLEGAPIREITTELKVSSATVYNSITSSRRIAKAPTRFSSYKDVKQLSDRVEIDEVAPRRLLIDPRKRAQNFCV